MSEPNTSEIKVFDCETMTLVRRWKVERAGPLAMDRWGNLAMLQTARRRLPARVLCFGRGEESRVGRPRCRARSCPAPSVSATIGCSSRTSAPPSRFCVFAPVPDAREMKLVETLRRTRRSVGGQRRIWRPALQRCPRAWVATGAATSTSPRTARPAAAARCSRATRRRPAN